MSEPSLTKEQLVELRAQFNELEIIPSKHPAGPGLKLLFAQALLTHAPQLLEAAERGIAAAPEREIFRPLCQAHPTVNYKQAWGCPECVSELRAECAQWKNLADNFAICTTELIAPLQTYAKLAC